MKLKEITGYLESLAPLNTQESYDNSGLIFGDPEMEVTNALISLDCIEDVVDEAIRKKCNLIISHHPIVFKGLKKLNGKNYVERTAIKAIQNNIALYAIHTNLDNYRFGVNKRIGDLLGIDNPEILSPVKGDLFKLSVFCPWDSIENVSEAMFEAGAGRIGDYEECSFRLKGEGTFKGNDSSNPTVGLKNVRESADEIKLEVIVDSANLRNVTSAMLKAHTYEEVAYDVYHLENSDPYKGAGMVGKLQNPMSAADFLSKLKETFNCSVIRHTNLCKDQIEKVAWCGGSGSFLLNRAKSSGADIYITGDYKYHDFFDAEGQIIIADIGHYESEQFTTQLIADLLQKKFATFAPCLTEVNTNPVKYFF